MAKQKSFLVRFTWVAVMLLFMGLIFSSVALVLQLVPIAPENISVSVNGVRQPSTQESVDTFRFIFLMAFGIPGLALLISGGIAAACMSARKRRVKALKNEGACVTAMATELTPSAIRVNHRYLMRLNCAYTAPNGTTYIFKSRILRMNPFPYLNEGWVKVYYDRDNIKRYFVDVDSSVGLGTRLVEL